MSGVSKPCYGNRLTHFHVLAIKASSKQEAKAIFNDNAITTDAILIRNLPLDLYDDVEIIDVYN